MDQSTRMLRTLGVLVLSMTGTASLLGWADPGATLPSAVIPPADLIQMAQGAAAGDAATGGVGVRADHWNTIELVAGRSNAGGDRLLLAATGSQPAHFTLDDFGRCSRSDLWLLQRDSSAGTGAIRVEIAQNTPEEPMSAAQWTSVRALVGALQSVVSDQSLEVVVDATWALAYGVVAGDPVAIDSIPVSLP